MIDPATGERYRSTAEHLWVEGFVRGCIRAYVMSCLAYVRSPEGKAGAGGDVTTLLEGMVAEFGEVPDAVADLLHAENPAEDLPDVVAEMWYREAAKNLSGAFADELYLEAEEALVDW